MFSERASPLFSLALWKHKVRYMGKKKDRKYGGVDEKDASPGRKQVLDATLTGKKTEDLEEFKPDNIEVVPVESVDTVEYDAPPLEMTDELEQELLAMEGEKDRKKEQKLREKRRAEQEKVLV